MSLALPEAATAAASASAAGLRRIAAASRRWAARETAFGRFALWLPVCTATGIGLAVAAPFDPSPILLGAILAALLLLAAVAGRWAPAAFAAGPLVALAATAGGGLLLALQAELAGTPLLAEARTVTMTARVVADEARGDERTRLVLAPLDGNFGGAAPRRVRVSVAGAERWRAGETVRVTARLFPLRGPVFPGGYDAARRLYFDGIGATGFAFGTPERLAPPPPLSARALVDALRDGVEARISAALEGDGAALATALLVGRRGAMSVEDTEALRISGLGHILAISGLHMALVAGSVFAAVRLGLALVPPIALRHPIRKWAAVAGLLAATVYLALSGASVATVRAYVMLAIALVAILADRPALTIRTVAVAAVVVMIVDPVSVVEPGFQMSFLAVVALVGAYEWWASRGLRRARVRGTGTVRRRTVWRAVAAFVIGLAATSLIAGLATAIAGAYHFHRVAPLGLLGNLAAMPVLSLVAMPAGVVALALMPLGLEGLPLQVMDRGLALILAIAHQVADLTGDGGEIGAIPAASALLSAFGLLWLAIFTAPWRLAGALFVAAGVVLVPFGPRHDLLVADDGRTVAARGPDGRLAILGDTDGFAASVWLKADGDRRSPGADVAGGRCDPLGCTLALADGVVAVARSPRALLEDCAIAKAVVSTDRILACPAHLVIDRAALQRHGAHAARRDGEGWAVLSARPRGPVRAWHLPSEVPR